MRSISQQKSETIGKAICVSANFKVGKEKE